MKKRRGLTRRRRVLHRTYNGNPLAGQKLAKRLGVPFNRVVNNSPYVPSGKDPW